MVQAWLQEVAWTEAHQQQQLAERNSRARDQQELQLLQTEPMFNFETALKLLRWSSLAYSDLGQISWPPTAGLDSASASDAPPGKRQRGELVRGSSKGSINLQPAVLNGATCIQQQQAMCKPVPEAPSSNLDSM